MYHNFDCVNPNIFMGLTSYFRRKLDTIVSVDDILVAAISITTCSEAAFRAQINTYRTSVHFP